MASRALLLRDHLCGTVFRLLYRDQRVPSRCWREQSMYDIIRDHVRWSDLKCVRKLALLAHNFKIKS